MENYSKDIQINIYKYIPIYKYLSKKYSTNDWYKLYKLQFIDKITRVEFEKKINNNFELFYRNRHTFPTDKFYYKELGIEKYINPDKLYTNIINSKNVTFYNDHNFIEIILDKKIYKMNISYQDIYDKNGIYIQTINYLNFNTWIMDHAKYFKCEYLSIRSVLNLDNIPIKKNIRPPNLKKLGFLSFESLKNSYDEKFENINEIVIDNFFFRSLSDIRFLSDFLRENPSIKKIYYQKMYGIEQIYLDKILDMGIKIIKKNPIKIKFLNFKIFRNFVLSKSNISNDINTLEIKNLFLNLNDIKYIINFFNEYPMITKFIYTKSSNNYEDIFDKMKNLLFPLNIIIIEKD